MNTNRKYTYGRHVFSLAALLLVLSGALVLSACESETEEVSTMDDQMTTEEAPTTQSPMDISELEGDPVQYVGQTVTVDGEVEEVYGQNAFTVSGGLFTGDLTVIVPPDHAAMSVMEGDDVRITGTVEAFVVTEIETDYGFDLTPEIESEIEESEPVLVAQTITQSSSQGPVEQELQEGAQELDEEL